MNLDLFNPIHLLLAYSGMFIHTAIQIQKASNQYKSEFSILKFLRYNAFHLVADLVAIPVILIIFTDSAMKELWNMNYLTATFTGYTSQSMLHSLFKIKTKEQ